ncbi:MAG: putative coat protein [Prokaryotic dsDNA virus sp.]|nr:MAG: putative coat protein [Prokaryotic dsDNA virus sp.]|tara:strand:+ start:16875 stop:18161 length:1287 start_codon:yes stop_codon:yes gene_type:complete
MPNNYQSNINNKLLKSFIKGFESSTVLMNTVSKQLVNDFDASTGGAYGAVSMKRPPQYVPQRTPDGDMSGNQANPVRAGKVQGEVSPNGYITVYVENTQVEEALEADQLDELLRPIAEDMVTELESELALYMTTNASLRSGASANAINKWSDIANAGALFKEIGAPSGMKYAAINSFDEVTLADLQTQLGVNPNVNEAWAGAVVKERFAGFNQVLTTNNLAEYTTGNPGAGPITLSATPASTYTAYKDTYRMTLSLTGLTATTGTLSKGQQLQFTDASYLNLRNRKSVRKDGAPVEFTCTVLEDVTADGAGNVTVQVSGAAIFETGVDGAFNTVNAALVSGNVATVVDTAATILRPALAYCEGFVGCGSVVLPKLHALDSSIMNYKGTSIRVHRFSDGVANVNRYRFDILPTFATFMPEWGQQLFGTP